MGKPVRNTRRTTVFDEADIRQAFETLRDSKEKILIESAQRIIEANIDSSCKCRMHILCEEILHLIEKAEREVLYPGDKGQLDFETLNYELLKQILWRQAEVTGFERAEFIADAALETVGISFE